MDIMTIFIIGYTLYLMLRDIPKWRRWHKETIPQQLVALVRQAHSGLPFCTEFNISVSADMRQQLLYPLTQDQVEIIKSTAYPVQEKKFEYTLSSFKSVDDELSGTVLVNIRYRDDSKELDLSFSDVPITLCCTAKPGDGWKLSAVEHP